MPDHDAIYRSDAERYDALIDREDHEHRLPAAIRAVRNAAGLDVVDLGAGLQDAGDGRDDPARCKGAIEWRVLGAEMGDGPAIEPVRAVPGEAVQIVSHWMNAHVPRRS